MASIPENTRDLILPPFALRAEKVTAKLPGQVWCLQNLQEMLSSPSANERNEMRCSSGGEERQKDHQRFDGTYSKSHLEA